MKLNNIFKAASGVALVAAAAAPAQAALTVLDSWQLATPNSIIQSSPTSTPLPGSQAGVPSLTTGIGYLALQSGTANVEQQLDSNGQAFVGAQFREAGAIYTVTYVPDTVVGPNDNGPSTFLKDSLFINFTNVRGTVTSVNTVTGGFGYSFTSGSFSISDAAGLLASGSIVGIGGNTAATPVVGGVNGDSALLANLTTTTPGFDLRNSAGMSLLPALANGSVFFEATTNNLISGNVTNTAACSFDETARCATFTASSAGQAYVVQAVPEPGSIALVGLALGGLGLVRARSQKRSA